MSKRMMGTKITDFNKSSFDSKSGLYKVKPYKSTTTGGYKPKAYVPKNTEYKMKEYKPTTTGYKGTKPYQSHNYNHVYEYNPDYNPNLERPKRVPKSVPKVVVTPSPAPSPDKRPGTSESMKMWPARFNALESVKRQINMTFKGGSRVAPILEPIPVFEKTEGFT
ncbi:uncharacterized protein LOC110458120 [Mizuhopecten yessoensis]|uniref:Uncharacterized protein n=1 Tax=Mizuhopecten yessoensis TaxID=6573 RepID=A0A210Q7E7_MIZYE|nr:uncharacterized protein LOC110458120 [Mizuhopecten yessoensis]OWF44619.1 hypothetical protein KP79_PYT23846 [Mizuhopecten yessoensis]